MAELKKVTVEFDKSEKNGSVYVEFLTELTESQDRLALTARFKEEVEHILTKEGLVWSYLFKVTGVPTYYSGHKWLEFKLELLRVSKPLGWSERLYEAQITLHVRHLCHFVKKHVDSLEEGLLQDNFPEIDKTLEFVES